MTDTAIPLPDVPPQSPEERGELSPVQKQRAAALEVARGILLSRSSVFGGSGVGTVWSVQDLLTVADYVLAIGPWQETAPGGNDPDQLWRQGYDAAQRDALVKGQEVGASDWAPVPYERPFKTGPSALDEPASFTDLPPTGALSGDGAPSDADTEILPTFPEDALPR